MLNKPQGYDEAYTFTGESISLPAGKYVCSIVQVNQAQTRTGRPQLVVLFDIAEGEHKGFYQNQYEADKRRGSDASWRGVYRQIIDGSSLPFFKGLMTAIERSNPGYTFPWGRENNEKTLVGKKIGIIMGREQFKASDGSLKWATKAVQVRSLDGLAEADVPADKPYEEAPAAAPYITENWMRVPDGVQEELPFN